VCAKQAAVSSGYQECRRGSRSPRAPGDWNTAKIVQAPVVDCSSVALDMTNFATFIATANGKAPIAQRGKAKQKRSDVRLICYAITLSMCLSQDGRAARSVAPETFRFVQYSHDELPADRLVPGLRTLRIRPAGLAANDRTRTRHSSAAAPGLCVRS
jgi:hypothetical protein